jgi:hypothetical protein
MTKKKILVLCTGNSARSQMGEGLFRTEGGAGFDVFSAGTKPSSVRPEAIAVMQEIGIDISGQRSKSVGEFSGQSIDYRGHRLRQRARHLPGVSGGQREDSLELRRSSGGPGQRRETPGCIPPHSRPDA